MEVAIQEEEREEERESLLSSRACILS